MEQIRVKVSPKQMSKLRNGHKVRVKPAIEGMEGGSILLVSPMNYSIATKTFSKNKGFELSLSPEELMANKEQAPSMQGQGIFGKKFDVGVEKALGTRGKKRVYQYAREVLNPLAKGAITAGLTAGASSLALAQPELIPFIAPAVPTLSYMAFDYLDRPSSYQSNAGGPRSRQAKTLAGQYLQDQALSNINSQLGTNMGNLSKAAIGQALEDKAKQQLTQSATEAQQALIMRIKNGFENMNTLSAEEKKLLKGTQFDYMVGNGLYPSGKGLYLGSRQGGAIVGNNGGLIHKHQALVSQPLSSNYQFRNTMPVAIKQLVNK